MNLPRFKIAEINPRLGHERIGDAFQTFVHDVLRRDYPHLHLFPAGGKDGAIDLSDTAGDSRIVCECKHVGDDDLSTVQAEWRLVAKRLTEHLADPRGPTSGQSQYAPWYRKAPAIEKFVFCTSADTKNQAGNDRLRDEITAFFQDLSARLPHLAHLSKLVVEVLDWSDLATELAEQPHLVFRWFQSTRPTGFVPLDEPSCDNSFSAYLRNENLAYYSRSEHASLHPVPAGLSMLNEDELLAKLDGDDNAGLIITGRAGVGKTRLMFELGRRALERGWPVLKVLRSGFDRTSLQNFAERLPNRGQALLLLDYIETRGDFDDFTEQILDLNETAGFRLRYVASCRTSHYQAVQKVERHQRVNLSPQDGQAELAWLRDYQRATVQRVLEQQGLRVSEESIAVCHDTPVLAVFLAFLQKRGRKNDLAELLREQDFGQWLAKRLAQYSNEAVRELSKLAPLFPLSHSVACSFKNPVHSRLLEWLAQDGWIESVESEETESARVWQTIHDVFADRMLVSHVCELGQAAELFFHELFRLASEYQSLPSAVFSVQRVRDQAPFNTTNWPEVFAARIRADTTAWRSARFTLLRSDLLQPHERVWLLNQCKDLWAGAESEPEFQNAVGWIIRRLVKHLDPPLDADLSAVLATWIARICPAVDRANFFLTWAFRYDPETAREPTLHWMRSRPRVFQTHYLITAWLDCGLPPHEIRESVVEWCRRHGETFEFSFVGVAWLRAQANEDVVRDFVLKWLDAHSQKLHAHFLLASWLEHTGDTDSVKGILERWLTANKILPQASRVFTAWLRASGETEFISDAVATWFSRRQTTSGALHVYREWLRAGGSKAVLHRSILEWLLRGDKHPAATRRALGRWLDSGGDPARIRPHLIKWAGQSESYRDADLVYRKWIEAHGDIDAVRQPVKAWLEQHGSELAARYMISSWLAGGGEGAEIAGFVNVWLTAHQNSLEACFVFPRWLEHTRDCAFVEPFLSSWIISNVTAFDARYVYEAWLNAGGSREMVRAPIFKWLALHERTAEARFVYDAWCENTKEVGVLRESLGRWLAIHETEFESDHAMRSWLDAGGDKEVVRKHLGNWLTKHGARPEASFVFQSWLQSGGERTFVQTSIQKWVELHAMLEDARYVCTSWLDAGGELALVREAMVARFNTHTTDPDAQFEYRAWLDGGGSIQEVTPFLARWLARNQTAFEARFVYKAWLEAGGDINFVRQPIHAWLKQHALTFEASFIYPRWLEAGGEVGLVADFIAAWLKRHDTTADASFIYEFWLKRGGGTSPVRQHIREWIKLHAEISQARFVYKAWLEAGGEFALVDSAVLRWMEKNQADTDSIFITRLISRERQLSDQTLRRLVAWTATLPQPAKCVSSFSQLGLHLCTPSLRNEIVETAERLLAPLLKGNAQWDEFVQGDSAIVLSYLLDSTRGQSGAIRDRVDSLFLLWLCHPRGGTVDTQRYKNIQRVEWLRRVGDLLSCGKLDVARDRSVLERFCRWVDSWESSRKTRHDSISAIESLKRRFPAPRLWDLVRVPAQRHSPPRGGNRFRRW